ncbi:MAG TPA: four helix bundle protein [Humisphaera sp.]
MATLGFEKLDVYRLSEKLADLVWGVVHRWGRLAKDTVGKQLIRAADSIGANIAEGAGRGSFDDNRRFIRIARGSLYETHHFLRRALARGLLDREAVDQVRVLLDELRPRLNAYLRSIGTNVPDQGRTTKDKGPRTKDKERRPKAQ